MVLGFRGVGKGRLHLVRMTSVRMNLIRRKLDRMNLVGGMILVRVHCWAKKRAQKGNREGEKRTTGSSNKRGGGQRGRSAVYSLATNHLQILVLE